MSDQPPYGYGWTLNDGRASAEGAFPSSGAVPAAPDRKLPDQWTCDFCGYGEYQVREDWTRRMSEHVDQCHLNPKFAALGAVETPQSPTWIKFVMQKLLVHDLESPELVLEEDGELSLDFGCGKANVTIDVNDTGSVGWAGLVGEVSEYGRFQLPEWSEALDKMLTRYRLAKPKGVAAPPALPAPQPCENCAKMQQAVTQMARENRSLEKRLGALPAPPDVQAQVEALADWDHKAWSGWMRHLFSLCSQNKNGGWWMPREAAERWMRQMNMPYADLSEAEKDSDRKEARQILKVISALAASSGSHQE